MKWLPLILILVILIIYFFYIFRFNNNAGNIKSSSNSLIDIEKTKNNLQKHLRILTVDIGERSVFYPDNIKKTGEYIHSFYKDLGLTAHMEPYRYRDYTVANIIADLRFTSSPARRYIVGAHYDSVAGTVGADDNASAIAVQLETARILSELSRSNNPDIEIRFVSFPLEEPPAYHSSYMGSRVYAEKAKRNREKIDGMICLEMVGYTCNKPGCQSYPFPLNFLGYPKKGTHIGIIGDSKSGSFTRSIFREFKKNIELPVIKLIVPLKGRMLPSVRLSDHASFWDAGYKAVMITDTAFYRNPNYHLSSDTMEKLDYNYMAELVESLVIFFLSHEN